MSSCESWRPAAPGCSRAAKNSDGDAEMVADGSWRAATPDADAAHTPSSLPGWRGVASLLVEIGARSLLSKRTVPTHAAVRLFFRSST